MSVGQVWYPFLEEKLLSYEEHKIVINFCQITQQQKLLKLQTKLKNKELKKKKNPHNPVGDLNRKLLESDNSVNKKWQGNGGFE